MTTSPPGVARATAAPGAAAEAAPGTPRAGATPRALGGQLAAEAVGGATVRARAAVMPPPPPPAPAAADPEPAALTSTSPPPAPPAAAQGVLDAVSRLLSDEAFHDVRFVCGRDGGVVTANRAFLSARNEFFEALLLGPHAEGCAAAAAAASSGGGRAAMATVALPAASSRALRRVLAFLHTGELPPDGSSSAAASSSASPPPAVPEPPAEETAEDLLPWRVLLETCGLAQQLLLPEVVNPLAERLVARLAPRDVGPALSAALDAGLQPVVGHIWRALPRLMPAGAGAWREAGYLLGGGGGGGGGGGSSAAGSSFAPSSSSLPLAPRFSGDAGFSAAAIAFLLESVPASLVAGPEPPPSLAAVQKQQQQQQQANTAAAAADGGAPADAAAAGTSAGDGGSALADVPADEAGTSAAETSAAAPPLQAAAAPPAAAAGSSSSPPPPLLSNKKNKKSSNSSKKVGAQSAADATESLADVLADLCAHARTAEERLLRGVLDWAASGAEALCGGGNGDDDENGSGEEEAVRRARAHQRALASLLLRLDWAAIAPHWLERVLAATDAVPALASSSSSPPPATPLLTPAQAAAVSRAALLCLHASAAGRLSLSQTAPGGTPASATTANPTPTRPPSFADADDPPLPLVRRLQRWGGAEVLECAAVPHVTVQSRQPFPLSGRHCFSVAVEQPCDLVWLGVSDGRVEPAGWGGKHSGGWFVGSNDALCHHAQSDRSAYATLCGLGKWGEQGVVVGVFLDCDAGECYFGLLSSPSSSASSSSSSELRPGFRCLPTTAAADEEDGEERRPLHAAASIRAPAQLAFRFRPWSWLQGELLVGDGGGDEDDGGCLEEEDDDHEEEDEGAEEAHR